MTVGNALIFIDRGLEDSALRKRLNTTDSLKARDDTLSAEGLTFSDNEFDEAFHHRLTLCQEEEEADQLKEFKMWWDLLARILSPAACGTQCVGCGS